MGIGNLLGFKGAGKGASSGLPASGSSANGYNPPAGKKVIRMSDYKNQKLKNAIRNIGILKAHHKERFKNEKTGRMETRVVRDVFNKNKVTRIYNENGNRIKADDYDDNLLESVMRGTKSGQTVSSWKRAIGKDHKLTSISKDGTKRVYHISGDGANREKRKTLETIFDPKGPTKEERDAAAEKAERLRRVNVYMTNEDRRKNEGEAGMAGRITKNKDGKSYLKSTTTKNGRKITAQDIGAQQRSYSISAQAGSATSAADDYKGDKAGFAGSDEMESAASIGEGVGVKQKDDQGGAPIKAADDNAENAGKKGPGNFDNNMFMNRAA